MNNRSASKVKLSSFEDLFGSDTKNDEKEEKVVEVFLSELHTFQGHPFRVLDDEKMEETANSIKAYGVLVPGIVRPRKEGGYEIIAGHRRKRGSELAGKETMPVFIRDYSDDEATIIMVDSNIQRENLLYSEKAFAYKMKSEAIKHQGSKGDKHTADEVANGTGESGRTIQRYIRLTFLIKEIMQLVDDKKIPFGIGVDLSYLKPNEQRWVIDFMEKARIYPSSIQAEQLKKYSISEKLTPDIVQLLLEDQKPIPRKVVLKQEKLAGYFTSDYSSEQIEEVIFQLLEEWRTNNGVNK